MKADRYTIDIENPPAQNAGTNYLFPRSTPYDKAERFFAQAALRMVYAVYPGKLEKYVSAKIAVFIVYTFIIVSLILFVICLIPLLYHQMVDFMEVLPNWVEKVEQFQPSLVKLG